MAEASLSDPLFRKALPLGFAGQEFDRAQARETTRDLLQRLSAKADLDPILDRFVDEFISACPPLLDGQMGQIGGLDRLTTDSRVGARAGVVSHARTNGDSIMVECYGRRITFPARVSKAVRFALDTSGFTVRDLPGDLDDAGKITLVRRLIREGLLVALKS